MLKDERLICSLMSSLSNSFPRGEGAPVRTLGRKRNGDICKSGKKSGLM